MSSIAVRDDTRNDSQLPLRVCLVCTDTFPHDGRGRYCTPKCRQRAFRLRHRQANPPTVTDLAARLRREHRLIVQTVYECPSCQDRFLGERRCNNCHLWCRKVGLGGQCAGCDEVLTVNDLIGFDLDSKEGTPI
jgi:hypothetical protein